MNTQVLDRRVGDIVRDDIRTAKVFQRHGIDFCCGGGQVVGEACSEKGVDPDVLEADIAEVTNQQNKDGIAFDEMESDALIGHILETHHSYIRRTAPSLRAWSAKVATVHGARHPETAEIARTVESLCIELEQHMFKEERILFPAITSLALAMREGNGALYPAFGSIANPIAMMEQEHRDAGAGMETIRRLSGDFALPEDACATFTALYRELEAFEADLHLHIHLENNILFPNALAAEQRQNRR